MSNNIVGLVIGTVIDFAFWASAIYVVAHFIIKYW